VRRGALTRHFYVTHRHRFHESVGRVWTEGNEETRGTHARCDVPMVDAAADAAADEAAVDFITDVDVDVDVAAADEEEHPADRRRTGAYGRVN